MRLRLQGKILSAMLVSFILVFGAIVGFVSLRARAVVQRDAEVLIERMAQGTASEVEAELNGAFDVARTLAQAARGVDRKAPGARSAYMEMLRIILEETPGILSTWCVFEPDAFDGRDAEYAGREGFRKSGRFYATFIRTGGSVRRSYDITDEMLQTPGEGDWYLLPRNSGKEMVLEPYAYSYTGNPADEKFITSLAVPVKEGGRVIGVVGVDLDLQETRALVSRIRIFQRGTATLFSNGGIFVSSPDPKLQGTSLAELAKKYEIMRASLERIRRGETYRVEEYSATYGEKAVKVNVPVHIGRTETPWSVGLIVPEGDIYGEANRLTRTIGGTALAGILLLCGLVTAIVRRLVRPIQGVARLLDRFAGLDLREDREQAWLSGYRGDEIGDMTAALGRLRQSLAERVLRIRDRAHRFASGAESLAALSQESVASMEEIKASSDHVGTLAERSASALEEANAGIEEVSSSAQTAARSASAGAEAAERMTRQSGEAGAAVPEVVSRMKEVGALSERSAESLEQVVASVSSISTFVATIQSIADQTNLLALNAAIEAARAGEAGRGFAVVAEEVRKLAEESNQAAREVEHRITELVDHTRSASELTGQAGPMLQETIGRAQTAQDRIAEVVGEIGRVNEAMQSIAATAQEQAASSTEMARGIDEVTKETAQVVQSIEAIRNATAETARAAESVARESQDLSAGAEEIRRLMEEFRLDGDAASPEGSGRAALVSVGRG